jgi:hypothetical protein
MIKRWGILVWLLTLAFHALPAQSITGGHVVIAGSDGDEAVRAEGSEADLSTISDAVRAAFRGLIKSEVVLPMSEVGADPLFGKFVGILKSCDSDDMLLTIWIGPWIPDSIHPELSQLAGVTTAPITAEYVLNLIHFMPAKTSLNFILSPQRYRYPMQLLTQYPPSAASGGKHVMVVGAAERMSYEEVIEGFVETMREMGRQTAVDMNNDRAVTEAEWLQQFDAIARRNRVSLLPYWLESSPDVRLYRVREE